jgi:hypothetical protein
LRCYLKDLLSGDPRQQEDVMKTLKYLIPIAIIMTLSVTCAYAGSDKSDQLSSSQSSIFSPGWSSATMQRIREKSRNAKLATPEEQKIAEAEDELSYKVKEDSADKVDPEVKNKQSRNEEVSDGSVAASVATVAVSETSSAQPDDFGIKQTLSGDEQQELFLNTYRNTDLQPYYNAFDCDPARAAQRAAYLADAIAGNTRPGGYIMTLTGNNVQMATAMAQERTRVWWASQRNGYADNKALEAAHAYVDQRNNDIGSESQHKSTGLSQNPDSSPNTSSSSQSSTYLRDTTSLRSGQYDSSIYTANSAVAAAVSDKNTGSILKGLLANREESAQEALAHSAQAMTIKTGTEALSATLSQPLGNIGSEDMQVASALANILKDPNKDQEFVIGAVTELLKGIGKEDGLVSSEDIKKASDELLQVVANILIAQAAVPSILKPGDVDGIKQMFSELSQVNNVIQMGYSASVEPYYDELKTALASNQGIMSKYMMDKELKRSDIEKLIAKLREMSNRTSEEENIVKKEAELREKYLDPSKKMMEEKTKLMMQSFAQRLSVALESAKPAKK